VNRALEWEIVNDLRVSSPRETNAARSTVFSKHDWEQALGWLDQSGLALLYWNRLTALDAQETVPLEIGEALAKNLVDHRQRVAEMAQEFDSINRSLEEAGVRYTVLKGFALVPDYCSDASLRTMYDYDYLVRPADVDRAGRALNAAGYAWRKGREEHPLVYIRASRPPRPAFSRDELYSAEFPRTIELHHSLWEIDPLKIPVSLPEGILDSAESRTWQGLRFPALSAEDGFIFQVLHAFRHILRNWCRLCLLHDLAYFLERHSSDSRFWGRFADRIRGREPLPEIVGVVVSLAARLFGAPIPADIRAETTAKLPSALALWVERYGPESALNNFLANKYSLFLHREFIKDQAVWRRVRRQLLFPLQRPNRAVEASSPRLADRVSASCRQTLYGGRRIVHHLLAALRYGWESYRWQRLRAGGR
jgi:hypothetical protein